MSYIEPITKHSSDCDILTIKEFKEAINQGHLNLDWGDACPVKDGLIDMHISISYDLSNIPDDADSIIWFNK